jgi:[acyl-carrier-protein] S-malonyltransferase
MRPAADVFGRALAHITMHRARVPVIANVTAEPLQEADAIREELAVQLYSPVRWIESLQRLARMGCDRFLEVGPGSVLAGMVRRTLPDAKVASFGSLADLEKAATLVGA